jgi:diamine N-acetyltransferase
VRAQDHAILLHDDVVRLVAMDSSHAAFITEVRTDWSNYEYFFDFHLATREQEDEWISRVTKDSSQVNFVIYSVADPSQPAGTISLTSIDRRSRNAEYGRVFVSPKFRGAGVMDHASRLVLRYGFGDLNMHKIYLRVLSDNERAIRLYRRLGFEEEGCLREHVYKDGTYRDVTCMGLLADSFWGRLRNAT